MNQYARIAEAISFYEMHEFKYIDVPWMVDESTLEITMPPQGKIIKCDLGNLVGSAEQSFLQLALWRELKPGKYVSCTPCFRNDAVDEIHRNCFTKVELFINDKNLINHEQIISVVYAAQEFFKIQGVDCDLEETDDGYDLISTTDKIELGSYGVREFDDIGSWIYGTGLAEPRFSVALAKLDSKYIDPYAF
jgi:hypothetical protein